MDVTHRRVYYFMQSISATEELFLNNLAKSNLILNVPGELVIIRDLVINTSLKWNILTYFPSCGFLSRYLKLGANTLDGTVKTMLCSTWRSRGLLKEESQLAFPPSGLTWPWWWYHIPELDLDWNLQAQKFEVVSTVRLDFRSINYVHRTVVVNQNANLTIARERYCFHMR